MYRTEIYYQFLGRFQPYSGQCQALKITRFAIGKQKEEERELMSIRIGVKVFCPK